MVDRKRGKFMFNSEAHTKKMAQNFCMLLEEQHLVDVVIHCDNSSLHVHKNVLSLNSDYFKEQFERRNIDQIIINGLNVAIMKALIEFVYSGELALKEEDLKGFISAVKIFKIMALEKMFAESDFKIYTGHLFPVGEISIPPPQFICQSPKYSTVLRPYTKIPMVPKINYPLCNGYDFPQKCLVLGADRACAKEAQASRIALANLRKTMSSTPSLFIVEEPFCETTVENFIPNTEYGESENVQTIESFTNTINPNTTSVDIPAPLSNKNHGLTGDKIKDILENQEVEIMFQTNDGNLMKYSDNVFLNLSRDGIQYQVVGEYNDTQEMKRVASGEHLANNIENVEVIRRNDDFEMNLSMEIQEECDDHNLNLDSQNSSENSLKLPTELYGSMQSFMTDSMKLNSSESLQSQYNPSVEEEQPTYSNSPEIIEESSNPVEVKIEIDKPDDFDNSDDMLEATRELFKAKAYLKFTPDMFFSDPPSTLDENN